MDIKVWLTTTDNPYNPFKQFDSWFNFDVIKGYNTCSKIDRFMQNTYPKIEDKGSAVEHAIDKIIEYDFANIYRKVNENKFNEQIATNN